MNAKPISPDSHATGLTPDKIDALRYDGQILDRDEVSGLFNAMMPHGVRVLDVGCGTGSMTLLANQGRGNGVFGIEPDAQRAALAASRGIDVFCGEFDAAYVQRHDRFDVVTFADVLEHLPAPGHMLQEAMGALKPGGLILASVPNVAHWTVRLRLLFGRFDYTAVGIMDATHLRWFTARTFRALFEDQGLEVLQMRQSAGLFLGEYHSRLLRIIPRRIRGRMVRGLSRVLPGLFGCQHVILARKPD